MRDAPGSGLAAPQIGVSLRVFTYDVDDEVGHLINPILGPFSEEMMDGEEGCLSLPGLSFDLKRPERVVAAGQNMYGDPVVIEGTGYLSRALQHETDHLDGVIFIDRLDKAAAEAGEGGDTRGRVVRRARARRQGQPAPAVRSGAVARCACSLPAPPRPRCRACGRCSPAPTARGRRRAHPARCARRAAGAARHLTGKQLALEAGIEVLTPQPATRARVPRAARRDRTRLLPGRGVRGADPAGGARHPEPRLGQPALLAAARLARGRAGAARAAGRRRHDRRDDVPAGGGHGHRPVLRDGDRADRRRTTPSGDLLLRLAESGARLLVATLDGIEDASSGGPAAARRRRFAGAQVHAEDARVRWSEPAVVVDRLVRAVDPGARRVDDLPGAAAEGRPGTPERRVGDRPRRARRASAGSCSPARRRWRSSSAASSPRASRRWPPTPGRAACGCNPVIG